MLTIMTNSALRKINYHINQFLWCFSSFQGPKLLVTAFMVYNPSFPLWALVAFPSGPWDCTMFPTKSQDRDPETHWEPIWWLKTFFGNMTKNLNRTENVADTIQYSNLEICTFEPLPPDQLFSSHWPGIPTSSGNIDISKYMEITFLVFFPCTNVFKPDKPDWWSCSTVISFHR